MIKISQWYKGNKELNKLDFNAQQGDGVVTIEIVDCGPKDSGKYRCVAQNDLGIDETTGVVIVEGKFSSAFLMIQQLFRSLK